MQSVLSRQFTAIDIAVPKRVEYQSATQYLELF